MGQCCSLHVHSLLRLSLYVLHTQTLTYSCLTHSSILASSILVSCFPNYYCCCCLFVNHIFSCTRKLPKIKTPRSTHVVTWLQCPLLFTALCCSYVVFLLPPAVAQTWQQNENKKQHEITKLLNAKCWITPK